MEQALVTGATGFVGSHLVQALVEAGVGVRALVRRTSDTGTLQALGIQRVEGGLEDEAAVARASEGADVVFHLAALKQARSRDEYFRVNTGAVRVAALAARAAGARLVYLSSMAAVGPARDGRPVVEADEPAPITDYGRSKLAGEAVCREVGGEAVILRAPAVYGPGDRDLLRFFAMAARGVLLVPGGPDRLLQLLHVRDLVGALVQAGRAPRAGGLYHVADPRPYAWRRVVELVAAAVGRRVRVLWVPPPLVRAAAAASEWGAGVAGRATIFNRDKARELLASGWLCDTAAAERELAFQSRVPLATGLTETAQWYRARGWL